MNKNLLIALLFFAFQMVRAQQTVQHSFECRLNAGYQEFTVNEITEFINKAQFENFRLLEQRDTLKFANGFDIILYSARELLQSGLVKDITAYKSSFLPQYKLPVFHLTSSGEIGAEYPRNQKVKYSTGRK